jgi:hypothetical protein
VVEGARLESVYTGNRIVGSNPTLTATHFRQPVEYYDESGASFAAMFTASVTVARVAPKAQALTFLADA